HDWEKAESHTIRALEIATSLINRQTPSESTDTQRVSRIFKVNLALIYAHTERAKDAQRVIVELIHEGEHAHDYYTLGLAHLNLAEMLLNEVRLNECQRHARKAMAYTELSGARRLRVRAQLLLGESFRFAREVTGVLNYS